MLYQFWIIIQIMWVCVTVCLVHFKWMTLKCFYSWVKSKFKEKRYTMSSYNVPLRLLCNKAVTQATELAVWSNKLHTHIHRKLLSPQNANLILKSGEGREHVHRPLPDAVLLCLRGLIDWYCVPESKVVRGAEVWWPGICCVQFLTILPIQLGNVMSILLFCVCNFLFYSGFQQGILKNVYIFTFVTHISGKATQFNFVWSTNCTKNMWS